MKFASIARWGLLLAWCVLPASVLLAEERVAGERAEKADPQAEAKADTESLSEDPSPPAPLPASEERGAGSLIGTEANAEPDAESLKWLSSLAEGHRESLVKRRPVLARAGAAWCPICQKLNAEIAKPQVQTALHRWTRVYVDVDLSPDDAAQLHVGAVPAWRIRTAGGQTVATLDGFLPAKDLVDWLAKHYEAAAAAPADVLLGSGKPDAVAVVQLVRQFGERNPAIREAAIQRLLPHPDVGRLAVVKAFGEGNLAVRLAAFELLTEWKAPIGGIDPWRPETITDQSNESLQKWCDEELAEDASRPNELSDEELAGARRQIDRMLKSTDAECEAIRERLARLGVALLPEVYARLQTASADQDRQRLLALRYRLVADDTLVLRWPGGIVRLAATDSHQRQQAAQELARLATADDQRLLLELFSDPDPLVREISLQGLQYIGGREATAALVKLLADPEPNVRAAVLKQLEEAPEPSMVPKVAEYVKTENDPDLIVHAIRFLRTAGGKDAIKGLMSLLEHESWQVRAEAAAGLGDTETSFRYHRIRFSITTGDDEDDETSLQADVYVALLKLLEDPDAFVVSRAVQGLDGVDMAVAVDPLVKAAASHPNLASQIVTILAQGDEMRPKALPHVRKFCRHEDPAIRAAAIEGVCQAAPDAADKEIAAGLEDAESVVRVAAASAVFRLLENAREHGASALARPLAGHLRTFTGSGDVDVSVEPEGSLFSKFIRMFKGRSADGAKEDAEGSPQVQVAEQQAMPPEEAQTEPSTDDTQRQEGVSEESDEGEDDAESAPDNGWDQWLDKFYGGEGRAEWMAGTVAPLEKMLQAESPEERTAAAQTLIPLGKGDLALPVVLQTARSHPEVFDRATQVLPWLVWEKRLDTFTQLRQIARDQSDFAHLVYAMNEVPDRRAADVFWELLADESTTVEVAYSLQHGLSMAYFGERYYSPSEVSPSARRKLVQEAKRRATGGPEVQRLTVLVLLAGIARDAAAELAAKLADDPQLGNELRTDAFQVLLATLPKKEAVQRAIAALDSGDASRRKLALTRLVEGPEGLSTVRGALYINNIESEQAYVHSSNPTSIVPLPPEGLEAQHVRPLLDDPDPKVAANAGYLLTLFGQKEGLEPLLRYWREQDKGDDRANRLVYRAVAALDDSAQVSVLEEIYGRLDEYRMKDFYWTIRIMSGPEILRFRKRVRDEVGMSNLR